MSKFFIFILTGIIVSLTIFLYDFLRIKGSIEEYLLVVILFRFVYFDLLVESVDFDDNEEIDDEENE